jgi:Bax protein
MKIKLKFFPSLLLLILLSFAGLSFYIPDSELEPELPEYQEYLQVPDFRKNNPAKNRVENFSEFLSPIIEYENLLITHDRNIIYSLKQKTQLSGTDSLWLQEKTNYYKLNLLEYSAAELQKLYLRVDIIPSDLVLAQAAIESNWGSSAFARKYNNLFGTRTRSKKNGVIPKLRSKGSTFRVASYRTVNQSIRSYLRNLNTHSAYQDLRWARWQMRQNSQEIDAWQLSEHLTAYSTLGYEYVKIIQKTMRRYGSEFQNNK